MTQTPRYNLAQIQAAELRPSMQSVVDVAGVLGLADAPRSRPRAIAFMKKLVAQLVPSDFSGRFLKSKPHADVYGKISTGVLWYIKLFLDQDPAGSTTVVMSFHKSDLGFIDLANGQRLKQP